MSDSFVFVGYLYDIPVMFCKHYSVRNRQFRYQLQVLFLECTRKR